MIKFIHKHRSEIFLYCTIFLIFQNIWRLPDVWGSFVIGLITGIGIGFTACLIYIHYRD